MGKRKCGKCGRSCTKEDMLTWWTCGTCKSTFQMTYNEVKSGQWCDHTNPVFLMSFDTNAKDLGEFIQYHYSEQSKSKRPFTINVIKDGKAGELVLQNTR